MGIPNYFYQIIKRHKHIVTPYKTTKIDNLYLDSNSIIYDIVYSMEKIPKHEFDNELIIRVCQKLLSYIQLINPSRVFIAFDGVPPMAKMKQQRERRYKSWVISEWSKEEKVWDTVQITPGTPFMKRLDEELHTFFKPYRSKYTEFHLSTSQEPGEGEHKLFDFIRKYPEYHDNHTTMIYGLDSDLIILSLNHLSYCKQIQLLREAPAFMIKDTNLHLLDINELSTCITNVIGKNKLYDYIFITLLLGNDFMPHFPALNLRTTGMDTLLNTYTECIPDNVVLFDGKTIYWEHVEQFIYALSKKEEQLFIQEHNTRNNKFVKNTTYEDRIHNLPMLKREKEFIICPVKPNWQSRYYSNLLSTTDISDICINYIQMLEWNIQYYTTGCTNWSIYYKYSYPPLLEDLVQYVPLRKPIQEDLTIKTPNELLEYVFPNAHLHYLPFPCNKKKEPTMAWSYCTYMWETHVQYNV
jgi:5'-3' exoribonuclease 1